jgi:Yip1-like protein
MLIFNASKTWETIKAEQRGVAQISSAFLLPLLALSSLGEALGMLRLGIERGTLTMNVVRPSTDLVLRYELVQAGLSLVIVYLGAFALQKIGASFHRRHSYQECFTTLVYSMSPLYLVRLLDGVPAVYTWACYGIGIFLALGLFYRGLPFIMRPDPSNALGLFVFCSFLLLVATALAHWVATLVLDEKILGV